MTVHVTQKTDGSGRWFGGLFSKFGRRDKNEMILPDDKNPSVSILPCYSTHEAVMSSYCPNHHTASGKSDLNTCIDTCSFTQQKTNIWQWAFHWYIEGAQ